MTLAGSSDPRLIRAAQQNVEGWKSNSRLLLNAALVCSKGYQPTSITGVISSGVGCARWRWSGTEGLKVAESSMSRPNEKLSEKLLHCLQTSRE
jgi:hypothetical protein